MMGKTRDGWIQPSNNPAKQQTLQRFGALTAKTNFANGQERTVLRRLTDRAAAETEWPNEGPERTTSREPVEDASAAVTALPRVSAQQVSTCSNGALRGDGRWERFVMRRSQKTRGLGEVLAQTWEVTSTHQDWITLRRIGRIMFKETPSADGPN